MAAVVVAIGATMLATQSTTAPPTDALTSHVTTHVSQLPSYLQPVARSAIQLLITMDGHVATGAAMVIEPGDLAVTTAPIPVGATVFGASQTNDRFSVSLVDRVNPLGITVLRLSKSEEVTPTQVLPASEAVMAISPYFSPNAIEPKIAWGATTLGDPDVEQADGVVSYLETPSDADLGGFVDTLAVDNQGSVVAVLSAHGQWYSAQYITRVAQVVAENKGCHARLGVRATSAQGGGVAVLQVESGPSTKLLRANDILTNIGGTQLQSLDSLLAYLYATPPQQRVAVSLLRNGQPLTVDITLGCQP